MKKLLIILLLLASFKTAFARFKTCDELQVKVECGERWELLWEIGERLKYAKPADVSKLESLYQELAPMKAVDFTQSKKDEIRAQLPLDDTFRATNTPELGNGGSEKGSVNYGILAVLGAIVLIFLGGLGISKYIK